MLTSVSPIVMFSRRASWMKIYWRCEGVYRDILSLCRMVLEYYYIEIYRNSGNFHCHVIFVAIQKNKCVFYIRFRYKKLKLKTNEN